MSVKSEPPGMLRQALAIDDQAAADAHFERLVGNCLSKNPGMSRADAEAIERCWIASFALTYGDAETQARVARLFGADASCTQIFDPQHADQLPRN
jgi:hypothetical protein